MTNAEMAKRFDELYDAGGPDAPMPDDVSWVRRGNNSSCFWVRCRVGGKLWALTQYKKTMQIDAREIAPGENNLLR